MIVLICEGDQAVLMTGMNLNGYGPPKSFCFDDHCDDPPFMVRYAVKLDRNGTSFDETEKKRDLMF